MRRVEPHHRAEVIDPIPLAPSEASDRIEAEHGSKILERECNALFWRFARQHGITPHEARILLQDTGVRL